MTLPFRLVADELQAAPTRGALVEAAQHIQYVDGIADRDRLGAIVKKRLEDFKQQ